jgi:hypothetical protein
MSSTMKVVFELTVETDNSDFFKKVSDEDAADAALDGWGFPEHLTVTSRIIKKEEPVNA